MSRYNRFGGRENTICGSSKIANENRCQLIEVSEAKAPGKHDEKIQRRGKWHFDAAFICTKVEALGEGSEKSLPKGFQSCLEGRIGTFGNCGAARSWRLFLESRGRQGAVAGCAGKPSSIWHWVEGRKLAALEVGKGGGGCSSGAELGHWNMDLNGGAQVFEMQVFAGEGTEPARLEVVTVGLFCSILSTLRLPRLLVVQYTLRNDPKLYLV